MTEPKRGCPQCLNDWPACVCVSWPAVFIRFSLKQLMWMLAEEFNFPPLPFQRYAGSPPKADGKPRYRDPNRSLAQGTAHIMTTADEVRAELEARLRLCGEAGEALQDEVLLQGVEQIERLSRPARRALYYCSGWRRRKQTYAEWKYDQDCRTKNRRLSVL